jgi:hypothetical protein
MKLMMIIIDTECREELEVLFKHHDVTGYTEIPNTHGVGETGIRMGSGAYPKTSSIFFTVVEPDQVQPLKEGLCTYCDACKHDMKMILWGVEEVA